MPRAILPRRAARRDRRQGASHGTAAVEPAGSDQASARSPACEGMPRSPRGAV